MSERRLRHHRAKGKGKTADVLSILEEDPYSVPSNHLRQLTSSRGFDTSSLHRLIYTHQWVHIIKNNRNITLKVEEIKSL